MTAAKKGARAALSAPATQMSFVERYRTALLLFAGSLAVFCLFSGERLLHQSLYPHFVYQADAFLHGQLALRVTPPNYEDWARVGDKWYVSFPPFPAVLLMPFVAVMGLQLNDVLFTVVCAAASVALIYLVLERLREEGDSQRSARENALLALLFAFGTVNFYISIRGEVWFTAEVIGVTLTCLYLLTAHRARHPAWAGLFFACATITRTPLAFSGIYFALELLMPEGRWDPAELKAHRSEIVRKGMAFLIPVALVAIPMALMNQARFGSITDFGHGHLYNNRVNADIERWGLFNYHYLERNLHAAFTRLPTLTDRSGAASLGFDFDGMSLFLTTPLLGMLLWPIVRPRLHRLLWLTTAAISVPGFFYQNTGWRQFGFRFSLDYTPYLFLLLALGGRKMGNWFWVLGLAGVLVNIWGALVFK
jgi:hypothetical protein